MPLTGVRVLVVDDHSDSRDMVEEALHFLGATVITAPSAEAAATRLAEADVITTDYALPGHDGVWLFEQVQQSHLGIPVILVSGFAANQIQAVDNTPFALKLVKPIDPLELGRRIGIRLLRRSLPLTPMRR
jgi:CheY-like chemotaxis protein